MKIENINNEYNIEFNNSDIDSMKEVVNTIIDKNYISSIYITYHNNFKLEFKHDFDNNNIIKIYKNNKIVTVFNYYPISNCTMQLEAISNSNMQVEAVYNFEISKINIKTN